MEHDIKNKAEKFLNRFDLKEIGFYDSVAYSDGSIGFSAKKDFNKKSKNVSQLSAYVHEGDPSNISSEKKPLVLHATYGEKIKDGIRLRSDFKLSDPLDIVSRDEYFYDVVGDEFYEKNKKIKPNEIIKNVYAEHIKSTRLVKGFWLRAKMIFCRKFLRAIFKGFSRMSFYLLWIISGIRYSYEYIADEILKADENYQKYRQKALPSIEEGKKISFLGYTASQWSIIFYSMFHAGTYTTLMFLNYKPVFIRTIFNNNFLTVVYVIVSLWFLEVVAPISLKFLVKYFSKLEHLFRYKTIKT